jgi:hypothetical protein
VSDLRPGTRIRFTETIPPYAHPGEMGTVKQRTKNGTTLVELIGGRLIYVYPNQFEVIAAVPGE